MSEVTKTIVLQQATLIDGTGAEPSPNSAVVIENERIKDVIKDGTPGTLPADTLTITCHHQTLLPGLIDAHSHMSAVDANLMEQQRRNFTSLLTIRAIHVIRETLEQGFTTIRDCGGIDPGFRQAVEQGLIPGPRLFVSGKILSQTGGHGDDRLPTEMHQPVEGPGMMAGIYDGVDAVRRGAREQLRQGVDFLKVMAGGGCMSPSDEIDTTQYSLEELKAIAFEAQAVGKYVSAHVYSAQSIINSVTSGIRTLEHGNLLNEAAARVIKQAGAYLVPTLTTYHVLPEFGKQLGIPEYNIQKMVKARDASLEALELAYRTGVNIASGSDLLGPMQTYKGLELELKAKVMTPMEALVSATKTNAELLNKAQDLGTLEPGKLADMIVVDGDPLQNISLFQQYQEKITLIMQGGLVYKNILYP